MKQFHATIVTSPSRRISSRRARTAAKRRKLSDTRDAARKALAVLRDVEWPGDVAHTVSGPYITCPMCEEERQEGHAGDCALAEAISDLEAVLL